MLATGERVRVGISIGVAVCRPPLGSVDALLAQVDRALYRAKGRSPVRLASAGPG